MSRSARALVPVLLLVLSLAALPALAQVTGTIIENDTRQRGTSTEGLVLLYSPDPVQQGSSLSHWDVSASPNLLMEPSINPDLPFFGLDITPDQMTDIGWNQGNSNFNIISLNDPGSGFTDPTPFAGAPGNPATTLGEARVNLFNALLGVWGSTLESPVDIDVLVLWDNSNLFCQQGVGAVLAAAGTTFIYRDNAAFPEPGTWYHSALAEALAGTDLSPADEPGDIVVFMNDQIDNECLGADTGYYYGLDGMSPSNRISVSEVVLHELAHGLGFSNFTNETTGALINGFPSIFDLYTLDLDLNQTWDELTDAQRVASAENVGRVAWAGADANASADVLLLTGVPELTISSPASIAGTYNVGTANFGAPIPDSGLTGEIACLKDGVADATSINGCSAAINAAEIDGKIALIDRGGCSFVEKATAAQNAGAIGVVVVNNAGATPLTLGGSDPSINIPVVSVGSSVGNRIRAEACGGAAAFVNDGRFQVTADWATDNATGQGTSVMLTDESGYFWFFREENVEVLFKVIDACAEPNFNTFWVFAAGLTNVEVTMTVVDTDTGAIKQYINPNKTPFPPIQDTQAFATCP